MSIALGLICGALGIAGAAMHVQASLAKGAWVGTVHEVKLVAGTFMALTFLPAAVMLLVFS